MRDNSEGMGKVATKSSRIVLECWVENCGKRRHFSGLAAQSNCFVDIFEGVTNDTAQGNRKNDTLVIHPLHVLSVINTIMCSLLASTASTIREHN